MSELYRSQALPLGTMIQEYRLVRVLGAGSFGIVYAAENKYFDETVAIKEFLPVDLARRSDGTRVLPLSPETEEPYAWALKNFLKEARILWELAHPEPHRNIVRVTRFHEENGTAYMVMDYEEGKPLQEVLEERKTLSEAELLAILFPLLDGLERVHAASIWHRDIKPANILIRADGSPVLIDFGAAHRETGDTARSIIAVFSPDYAAPEQLYPVGIQGPWTDIYGLGAMLYRAVSGKAPTPAGERVQRAPHKSAANAATGKYTPAFLEAIDAALELLPNDRPESITVWRSMLEATFRDRPTVLRPIGDEDSIAKPSGTKPSGAPQQDKRTVRTHGRWARFRRSVALASIIVLMVGLGVAIVHRTTRPLPDRSTSIDRDDILTSIEQSIATFSCADLTPTLYEDLTLVVSGFVSTAEDLQRLRTHLRSIENLVAATADVAVYEWPFCEMMALLKQYQIPNQTSMDAVQIHINKASRTYEEGELLIVRVKATNAFDGYLYVDYVDNAGDVLHMLPSPVRFNNAVIAGQQVWVGSQEDTAEDRYQIAPPHGQNMILAISTDTRLFDEGRQEVESADTYITALRKSLQEIAMQGGAGGVVSSFEFITTHE